MAKILLYIVIPIICAIGFLPLIEFYQSWKYDSLVDWGKVGLQSEWWSSEAQTPDSGKEIIEEFSVKNLASTMASIRPRLEAALADPTHLLPHPPLLPRAPLEFGLTQPILKHLLEHWLSKYNASEWESRLNTLTPDFSQFRVRVEGIWVHCWRARTVVSPIKNEALKTNAERRKVTIMLVHGWPSTPFEFYKTVQALTNPFEFPDLEFEVIVPSLPGFAWSEASTRSGLSPIPIARIFLKLMTKLYSNKYIWNEHYFLHGTDWGSIITRTMAVLDPSHAVLGVHLSGIFQNMHSMRFWARMFLGSLVKAIMPSFLTEEEQRILPVANMFYGLFPRAGYFLIQGTRPDTLAAGLIDNPVSTLSWIGEKYIDWSLPPDDLFYGPRLATEADASAREIDLLLHLNITMDEIITQALIFHSTRSIGTSIRIYREFTRVDSVLGDHATVSLSRALDQNKHAVPLGYSPFRHEPIPAVPHNWLPDSARLVQYTPIPHGGHFGALQAPNLMAHAVGAFVRRVFHLTEAPKSA